LENTVKSPCSTAPQRTNDVVVIVVVWRGGVGFV
jgi:hypothetical protein